LVIVGGGYLYSYAWRNRRSGERERAAMQAEYARSLARSPGRPVKFLLVVFGGMGLAVFATHRIELISQARHPAVKEHLAELTALAEIRMGCPQAELTVLEQSPILAQVKGCHRELTFRWAQRVRGVKVQWNQIDPNCTIDYMGCALPCN
jgi:hypothetical protein